MKIDMFGQLLTRVKSCAALFFLLFLQPSLPVAKAEGVTIITHGYNPSIAKAPVWMNSLCDAISTNFLGGAQAYGKITVSGSATALTVTCDPWKVDLSSETNGDVLIVLDWSAVASSLIKKVTAQSVAVAVVDKIVTGQNGQRPLAELPIHLIGHSRGGSLICELAHLLGERGIVVDQLTPLDPHPLTAADSQSSTPVIDTPVAIYQNVVFADVYAQTNEYPMGEYILGACNRLWGVLSGGYYNNTYPYNIYAGHRNILLLYHGTVMLTDPMSNEEASIGAAERGAWFNAADQAGANTGFLFSRIAHGVDWASTNRPVAGGDAIRDGLNNALGLGGNGSRTPLSWSAAVWPNIAQLDLISNGAPVTTSVCELAPGATAPPMRFMYLDYDSGCIVTLHLDTDRNPYNNNDVAVGTTQAIAAATGGTYKSGEITWNASVLKAGTTYYLYAQVTDGARTRYLYAKPAVRLAAGTKPRPAITNVRRLDKSLVLSGIGGVPRATYYLLGNTNAAALMPQWTCLDTNGFGENGGFTITNTPSAAMRQWFYRLAY